MDHHGVRGPSEVTAAKRGDSARPAHGGSTLHPLSSELRVLLPFRKERAPLGGGPGGGYGPPARKKGKAGKVRGTFQLLLFPQTPFSFKYSVCQGAIFWGRMS